MEAPGLFSLGPNSKDFEGDSGSAFNLTVDFKLKLRINNFCNRCEVFGSGMLGAISASFPEALHSLVSFLKLDFLAIT